MNQDTLWKNYQLVIQKLMESSKNSVRDLKEEDVLTLQKDLGNALKLSHQLEFSLTQKEDLRIVHEVEEEIEEEIEAPVETVKAAEEVEQQMEQMVAEFSPNFKNEDTSIAEKLQKTAIKDLTTAIGISEKFLYMNELFEGDSDAFKNCLVRLNDQTSFEDAKSILNNEYQTKYNWQSDNKYVQKFKDLIERKFI